MNGMTYPRPSSVTRLVVAFALLALVVLRSWTIYIPRLSTEGIDVGLTFDPWSMALVIVASFILAGILAIYGSSFSVEATDELWKRSHVAFLAGVAVVAGSLFVGYIVWQAVVGAMDMVQAIDVLPLTVVVMTAVVVTMAILTAAGLYALVVFGISAIMGYLIFARAFFGGIHPVLPVLGAAVFGGGFFAFPYIGLVIEVLVTVTAIGGAIMVLHRRRKRQHVSSGETSPTMTRM